MRESKYGAESCDAEGDIREAGRVYIWEVISLLREALSFKGRTHGRQRILDLELSNEQVAKRIVAIYQRV